MLDLPDIPGQAGCHVTLRSIAFDDGTQTVTFGFRTEIYDGPWKNLGSITISTQTLYRLMLSVREDR